MPIGDPTTGTDKELAEKVEALEARIAELEKFGTLLLSGDNVDVSKLPVGTQVFKPNGHWLVKQADGTMKLERDIWLAKIPEPAP